MNQSLLKKQIVILGGGTAGITVAAQLINLDNSLDITIVEPSTKHYYQPLWTLAGAGIVHKDVTEKSEEDYIPDGVNWLKASVSKIRANDNQVDLDNGFIIQYQYLIVATGLRLRPDMIKGIDNNLSHDGVGSIYDFKTVSHFWAQLNSFKKGSAVFTMPDTAIKCGGAPQKIMYLSEEVMRENMLKMKQVQITFTSAKQAIFGIDKFSKELNKVIARKNIQTKFGHNLIEVDTKQKIAYYNIINGQSEVLGQTELKYDLLHITPPMTAHQFIIDSGLVHQDGPQKGWLNVDIHTLQHKNHDNIFSLGDVAGLPTAKTGAAVRKQAPVLVANLMQLITTGKIEAPLSYSGYSSCPLVTDKGKVIMAEFGYDNTLLPSFPFDPAKERYSMWVIKRYLLPTLYWDFMLRGQA